MSTTTRIDFGKLSLLEALDLAVLIEEEARDRYQEFAEQLATHHTPEAAAFFSKMARIEELHRKALADKRQAQFADQRSAVTRAMIFDVEAPEYDEARTYMTVRQALGASLRSEAKAHDFYAGALAKMTDPAAQALFTELRQEEVEHQALVKAELAKLPPEDKADPKDYEDEPTSED